ncbi:MAG: PhoU domain-containing protein, partial [Emergencia sp.]|nr:PhoU domain-containing protein [Emergencia sp.]
ISSALKMISDLERIGDQASDIAEIAGFIEGDHTKDHTHISAMGQAASAMVTDAVKSFVNRDLSLAHSVMKDDDIVDNHFEEVKKEIVNLIRKEEAGAELSLDLLMIAKYLERIGDHAVNVAEWVEFSITGEHLSDELRKVK